MKTIRYQRLPHVLRRIETVFVETWLRQTSSSLQLMMRREAAQWLRIRLDPEPERVGDLMMQPVQRPLLPALASGFGSGIAPGSSPDLCSHPALSGSAWVLHPR